jgi:hypothetical protein
MSLHDAERDERDDYEAPTVEDLDASDGPAVTAAGADSITTVTVS